MNFLDVFGGRCTGNCEHQAEQCEQSWNVGAFHGGVSEPLNYMLAAYRCKAVPTYVRASITQIFDCACVLESEFSRPPFTSQDINQF
jgi:hypothetical protein